MKILENEKLAKYTSLGIGGYAKELIKVNDISILPTAFEYLSSGSKDFFILGEGSNLCISDQGFDGLVICMVNKGVEIISLNDNFIWIKASAGENWDEFVNFTITNGWWGIENMSLIPGSVGACPVQNVGAYGQDCRDVIDSVEVYDIENKNFKSITNAQCNFGFRTSIFNSEQKSKFVITSVTFKLSKSKKVNSSRVIVRNAISKLDNEIDLQVKIRDSIVNERTNGINLPNKVHLGSSGTFFRTAIVAKKSIPRVFLKTFFALGPKIAFMILAFTWKYRSDDGSKLPSKLLINACGLGELSYGNVFLYKTNPAVLTTNINEEPSSADVIKIIKTVRTTVFEKTGVLIPIEPTLIGFKKEILDQVFISSKKNQL